MLEKHIHYIEILLQRNLTEAELILFGLAYMQGFMDSKNERGENHV